MRKKVTCKTCVLFDPKLCNYVKADGTKDKYGNITHRCNNCENLSEIKSDGWVICYCPNRELRRTPELRKENCEYYVRKNDRPMPIGNRLIKANYKEAPQP